MTDVELSFKAGFKLYKRYYFVVKCI